MKSESTVMPVAPYELEIVGDEAVIKFYDNVTEKEPTEEGEAPKWEWDEYELRVKYRYNLADAIEANLEAWISAAKAKAYEDAAAEIRAKRDALLKESDATMCLDRAGLKAPEGSAFSAWLGFLKAIGEILSGKWAVYRQKLRDIPQQSGFPFNVEFPEKPED